jgi:hypothetical protein
MRKINLFVDPGACGFACRIEGWRKQDRVAGFKILDSECRMINKLSAAIDELAIKDLFLPITRNPVFITAERACCHTACPVPVAIIKTLEVVLGLAVAKEVSLRFADKETPSGAKTA